MGVYAVNPFSIPFDNRIVPLQSTISALLHKRAALGGISQAKSAAIRRVRTFFSPNEWAKRDFSANELAISG